ncbi:hypothetical protein AAY77_07125 [Providencia rettgeri]|nr:hypothetical protein AAY77_07125 [Providencia rettgeri]
MRKQFNFKVLKCGNGKYTGMGLEQCIFYASPLPLSCEKTSNTKPLEQFLLADTFQEMLF